MDTAVLPDLRRRNRYFEGFVWFNPENLFWLRSFFFPHTHNQPLFVFPVGENSAGETNRFFFFNVFQAAVCRILGGNDKETCRTIAERFEEKYDQSLVDALKKELRGKYIYIYNYMLLL